MKTIEELIPVLQAATLDSRVKWNQSNVGYHANVGEYEVRTWNWVDPDNDDEGLAIGIYKKSQQIDCITADKYSPRYSKIDDIYQNARRSALDVSAAIASIEETLLNLPPSSKR